MPAIEVGRICIKILGREAGKKCVIVDLVDKNYVLITGPKTVTGIKRRRANISHLEATQEKIEINRGANDEEIAEALKTAGKLEDMNNANRPVELARKAKSAIDSIDPNVDQFFEDSEVYEIIMDINKKTYEFKKLIEKNR